MNRPHLSLKSAGAFGAKDWAKGVFGCMGICQMGYFFQLAINLRDDFFEQSHFCYKTAASTPISPASLHSA